MIAFLCSNCGAQLRVREELAGATGNCPRCHHPVEAPRDTPPGREPRAPARPRSAPAGEREAGPSGADRETFESEYSSARASLAFLAPPQGPGELGRLGNYRVLKVLGAGGMGVVLEAEDVLLQRPVALKVLKAELAASQEYRQRFLQEARAAAAIDHDHIVTIYQVGEDRNVPFLAMKLLQGEALEDRLNREGRLETKEVLRIGKEIAEGLAAAHARGLIHRDIKPANIWMEALPGGTRSRVRIVDFGLARAMRDDTRLTQTGYMMGTPSYMAPEQAEGEAADHRCDLFSLGCVLYRMCTGRLPFEGKSTMAVLMALATRDPKPPRQLVRSVPAALSDLILYLLNKKQDARPVSARFVVEALEKIEAGQTAAVASPSPNIPGIDDIPSIEDIPVIPVTPEAGPESYPATMLPEDVPLTRISGDELPPLQPLETEERPVRPAEPAPAPPPPRPPVRAPAALEEVEEEDEEEEEEDEEDEEKTRRVRKRKPARKSARPRKPRRQEAAGGPDWERRVLIFGIVLGVGVFLLIVYLIVRHFVLESEEKKSSHVAPLPALVGHHRRMDGLFHDVSQKRLEEERFCEASLNRRAQRPPFTATSAASTRAGQRGGATSSAPGTT